MDTVIVEVRGSNGSAGCLFFNDTATTEIYPLSLHDALPILEGRACRQRRAADGLLPLRRARRQVLAAVVLPERLAAHVRRDRKSTRLNSSHANISYAVFCLNKTKLSLYRLSTRPRPPPSRRL